MQITSDDYTKKFWRFASTQKGEFSLDELFIDWAKKEPELEFTIFSDVWKNVNADVAEMFSSSDVTGKNKTATFADFIARLFGDLYKQEGGINKEQPVQPREEPNSMPGKTPNIPAESNGSMLDSFAKEDENTEQTQPAPII